MSNPYETAAHILATLTKSGDVNTKEIPKITSAHLKSVVYSNSRSKKATSSSTNSDKKKPSKDFKENNNNNNDLRQIYAIVASTLQYSPILKAIITNSELFMIPTKGKPSKSSKGKANNTMTPERRYFVNEWHIYAMVYDLLLSKSKRITAPKCKTKEAILKNKTRLNGEYVKWKVRNRVRVPEDMKKFMFPIVDDGNGSGQGSEEEDTPVRWVRLNGIKIASPEEFEVREKELTKDGEFEFLDDWKSIKESDQNGIYKDKIIQNLYGVSPFTSKFPITMTKLYATGRLIIQDRASCFPATILVDNLNRLGINLEKIKNDGESKRHVQLIDSCSAPGNKTTHLTALSLTSYPNLRQIVEQVEPSANIKNKKQKQPYQKPNPNTLNKFVAAFEKSPFRGKTLQKMLQVAGAAKYVDVNVQDFTKTSVNDYPNVVGLVVDPSCSGSGIFGRVKSDEVDEAEVESGDEGEKDEDEEIKSKDNEGDEHEESEDGLTEKERQRLLKLAGFQYKIVKHALSFPKAQVVVYSTCSIHAIENEHVVARLLNDPEVQEMGWTVQGQDDVVPNWHRRGFANEVKVKGISESEKERIAGGCVRALPKEDGGIGFFAVCFVRKF